MTLGMEWVETAAGARSVAPDECSVPLQGLILRAGSSRSRALFVFLRPASAWQLMPIERATADAGSDVLCATSRFARNEALATFEESLLDIGAWIRTARQNWGYERVLLLGWSGSGTLSAFYQAQAERPTIKAIPGGRELDLARAGLPTADGLIFQGAHASRARMLADAIDPSVLDEAEARRRDPTLDLYGSEAPTPPYPAAFLSRYRAAQRARIERISIQARQQLLHDDAAVRQRPVVVERTMADPHYLDPTIDPNERVSGLCWLGAPAAVNIAPGGIARISTPEAWLSQWSLADSNADAVRSARSIRCPLLAIENGADDAVPPAHLRETFEAAASPDKSYARIAGASHSYAGQPRQLAEAVAVARRWAEERELA